MSRPPAAGIRPVVHVITGLGDGGAERTLAHVATSPAGGERRHVVVALGGGEPYASYLREHGVAVEVLGIPAGRPDARVVGRLVALARRHRPALVHGWMYHGNLAALVVAAAARAPVLWNVRQTLAAPEADRAATELLVRIGARASRWTRAVVYNARRAAREHEAVGYDPRRRVVIPNGFDLERFRPDPALRRSLRDELGLGASAGLTACVARVHAVKDHRTLLAAFARVVRERPHAHLVLVGEGTERLAAEANAAIAARPGARGAAVTGLGPRRDVHRILAAADVAILASRAEAFPNVLGEAMACAVPCVATAVGDVAELVGETGVLVPPGDPAGLAEAWSAVLGAEAATRHAMGERARARIAARFSLDAARAAYHRLYSGALDAPPR